jgi:hypothetical protein
MHPSIMPPGSTRLWRACGALTAVVFLSLSPAAAQPVPARTLDIAGNAEVHAVPDAALVSIVGEGAGGLEPGGLVDRFP